MKKLIIATAFICVTAVSHAAIANWKVTAPNTYDGTADSSGGISAAKYSGAALLFNAGLKTQSDLFTLFADGSTIDSTTTGYAGTVTFSNGSVPSTSSTFAYGDQSTDDATSTYKFYFVLLEDDKIYFSNEVNASANKSATAKSILFGSQTGSSAMPAGTGYAGAGAWSSVPEPTSAMLLMLGLCGLALKRKDA